MLGGRSTLSCSAAAQTAARECGTDSSKHACMHLLRAAHQAQTQGFLASRPGAVPCRAMSLRAACMLALPSVAAAALEEARSTSCSALCTLPCDRLYRSFLELIRIVPAFQQPKESQDGEWAGRFSHCSSPQSRRHVRLIAHFVLVVQAKWGEGDARRAAQQSGSGGCHPPPVAGGSGDAEHVPGRGLPPFHRHVFALFAAGGRCRTWALAVGT